MEVMTRLFWKELRTQAQLWLAMLVGVVLLSLSITWSTNTPTERLSDPLVGLVYVLTAGFAAASAAVLFAGEAEDGQVDWLRQLPMNTSQLVTGKVGFGVLATVLLLAASFLVAAAVARWSGFSLKPQFIPTVSSLLCVAACFVWGVFYSVLLSRVLTAIVTAAATTLFVQGLLDRSISEVIVCDVVHGCVLLIVALVDWALVVKWHRNDVLHRRRQSVAPAKGHSLSSFPLKWLVTTGPLEFRRWSVLFWKECAAALPPTVGAFAIVAAVTWLFGTTGRTVVFPIVIGLFGLRVFRSEQRENSIAFLSDRGVPAARVWLIKIGVWLTAVTIVISGMLIVEQVFLELGHKSERPLTFSGIVLERGFYLRLNQSIPDPAIALSRERDLVSMIWSLGGALFVALFAIGQMASFWIRRVILAFTAALLGCVLFTMWAFNMVSLDIPLGFSVWPAAILFLVATWDTRRFWMEQRTGWTVRRRQLVWILFPALLSMGLAFCSRGWQVPDKQPGFDWQQSARSLEDVDREWTGRWQTASTRRFDTSLERLVEEAMPDRRIDPLLMASLTGNDRSVSVQSLIERLDSNFPAARAGETTGSAEVEKVQQTLLGKQFERYKVSLKGIRYLSSQTSSWADFETCLQVEIGQLSRIRAWSAEENQSVELLEDALHWLNKETVGPETFPVEECFRQMVMRRYVVLRALFTGEGPLGTAIDSQLIGSGHTPHWFVQSYLGTPERRRLLNLLAWATDAEFDMPFGSLPKLEKAENRPHTWAANDVDYRRLAVTTPLLPAELRSNAAVETSDIQGVSNQQMAILNLRHSRAITVVAIALQWHRLKHGQFPESLSELSESPVTLPADPVRETPFAYTRGDDKAKAFQAVGRFIPGQPMLMSAMKHDPGQFNAWESRMDIQPNRVLVLPFNESLPTASVGWPAKPQADAPAVEPPGDEGGEMMGAPGGSMSAPPVRRPGIRPFVI